MTDYHGKNVLVLGLARSGFAVANLLLELGASVAVSDLTQRAEEMENVEALKAKGASVTLGEHPLSLLDEVDLVVKNPGIRYDVPILAEAAKRGIPIVTEIEVAGIYTDSPIIAITGSNGKTTTTTLIGEMFAKSGLPSVVSGNIGTALSGVVSNLPKKTWLVTEVSSFQLQGTLHFRPKISVLLNIYPTHLDYHGSFEKYTSAKLRLFANQGQGDVAVLSADKDNLLSLIPMLKEKGIEVYTFSIHNPVEQGLYRDYQAIYYRSLASSASIEVCRANEVALKGEFNLENALAAGTAALAAGVPLSSVVEVWRTFQGVEHRMEFVCSVHHVKFYNDSKATNPQAAIRAITSFSEPVIVILGGLERGDDLSVLEEPLRQHAKAVVVLGESAERMKATAHRAGITLIRSVSTIEEAVSAAVEFSTENDVILLSPAAASWDMFPSFEVRGRIFKEAVHKL